MEKYKKQQFKKYISFKKLRQASSDKQSFKKQPSKNQIQKKLFFVHSKNMENLTLDELKTNAEMRGITRLQKHAQREINKFH